MKFNNIIWLLIISILLYFILVMIHYLTYEGYIIECFSGNNTSETNNNVDLPLTNPYSCQNFCGPTARCAITGEQCSIDMDCKGCQITSPFVKNVSNDNIPGNNSNGKLTIGVNPQYSPLTSGYGNDKSVITNRLYGKPDQANFGTDKWKKNFNKGQTDYMNQYNSTITSSQYMLNYPQIYSVTGEFLDNGPLPSNY
jgi:hypothetical protein